MQKLVYLLILVLFSVDVLFKYRFVSRYFTWLPEIISLVALLAIVFYGARNKKIDLGLAYVVIFSLLGVHLLLGVILNSVPAGSLVTGIRTYFKFLPFFLLPVVYEFSPSELKRQLLLLLALSLMQLPVALYQRLIEGAALITGDLVGGTVGTSGHLSIYLVCVAAMWMAFYVRAEHKRLLMFSVVLLCILLPTTINSTKGTVLLAPVALLVPTLIDRHRKGQFKRIFAATGLLVVFLAIFIPIHDHYMADKWGYGLLDFFTMEGRVEKYLIRGDTIDAEKAGKIGGMLLSAQELSSDPSKFVFGLGIGNVSESFFGSQYSGEYFSKYGGLGGATVATLTWEIGWFGVLLVFIFCFRVFLDAMRVRKMEGIFGTFGLGWATIVLVMLMSFFYKNVVNNNILSYLFWFYSGLIAATAVRMRNAEYARWTKTQVTSHPQHAEAGLSDVKSFGTS